MGKLKILLTCLLVASFSLISAQTGTITGKVVSADDNTAIIGASVRVKGTSKGAITNNKGKFSIQTDKSAILVISYIGMKSVSIPAKNGMIVSLSESRKSLEEVVVTAIGQSKSKKALGYAATSIKGDDIASSKRTNPMAALSGKVAGLDVSSAPGPGATQNVIIRGASSFGNNQPLYIVDGVPLTNVQNRTGASTLRDGAGDPLNSQVDFGSGINALNPNDIDNMTILKGAAATALYGSRAANGVIMITTKSGKNTHGKLQLTYDGGLTISRVGFLPMEQTLFGQGWSGDRKLEENGSWGSRFDGTTRVWGNIIDGKQQVKKYEYLNNRVRDFYDLGLSYKNALSLRGGNANTNFYLSLSQNSVDGVIPTDNDSYKRYTISTRGQHKVGNLTASTSVNFSTEKTKAVGSGQGHSLYRSLNNIATDIPIVDLQNYKNKYYDLDTYFTPYGINPYFVLNENGNEQNKQKLFGKLQLDYNLLNNLKLTYRFGGDYETSRAQIWEAIIKISPDSPVGQLTSDPPKNVGKYSEMRRERIQINHDFMVNYNTTLFEQVSLNATVGFNANERSYSGLIGEITSIDIPKFYNLSNSNNPATSNQYENIRRLVGAYITADLSYNDYLYLTLTARNDWSSTLPKKDNSFFYPGTTLSFLITEFLNQQNISTGPLNFAKVRAAIGQTGNDADPYFIYDRYVLGRSPNPSYPEVKDLLLPLNGVNAYSVSDRLGNNKLQPEITTEFELGAELHFFANRLGLDFSYYNKYTKGLIELLPKDPSSGYTQQMSNLGDVRNKGFELAIDGSPIKTKNFEWNIAWNMTKNYNTVEKLGVDEVLLSGFGGAGIYAVKDQPIGQYKLYSVQKTIVNGVESTVVDGEGIPLRTTEDQFIGKDINEKFSMGLTNTLSYKGFTLGATLDLRYGGYIYSATKDYMHWVGNSPESILNNRKPFIIPNSVVKNADGSYSTNNVPVNPTALEKFYSTGGFDGQEYSVIDKSYLKLRNLSLAYQLPSSITKILHVSNINVSVNVGNILLWTPAENPYIDPETTTFGNDISGKFGEFGANPQNEVYTFGLSVKF